jgi:hypothetical protein
MGKVGKTLLHASLCGDNYCGRLGRRDYFVSEAEEAGGATTHSESISHAVLMVENGGSKSAVFLSRNIATTFSMRGFFLAPTTPAVF